MDSQSILVIVVVIIMGWFAFGVIYNLRRGDALLKWLQKGLPAVGEKTTFRWLGTSVAELVIGHARQPFRRLETLLVLKPRDVFWLTFMALIQARDDLIIFRGQLTTSPLFDLELADPKTWSGRNALSRAAGRQWEGRPYNGMQLMAPKGMLDLASSTLDRLAPRLRNLSPRFARLSLRRDTPNFEIDLPFPEYREADAAQYIQSLRDLARAISERE